ncbi:hypothetical protein [Actinomadura kijaniata]|uniref:hypothetical protein n=1 Tax=Actinomadura kijaniata TaxID=46161 RepID=UPI0008302B3E|nr:hypothetical protein [Actinomadura kijaniata]
MPKQQPTAAKKARAAARQGAKYTDALDQALTGRRPVPGPTPPPFPQVPFEVQVFHAYGYDHGVQGTYQGAEPHWSTAAWCPTAPWADTVARASVIWHGGAQRAQIWAPGPDGHRVSHQAYQAPAAPRPHRPARFDREVPPDVRPTSPAPVPEPVCDPRIPATQIPRFCLRVWSPEQGWQVAAWVSDRQRAATLAGELQVGVPGSRWPWGDVFGPGWPERGEPARVCMDLFPHHGLTETYAPPAATFAELYHPEHAATRTRRAAERQATHQATFADQRGRCSQCGHHRPLVWSWDLCADCYMRSAFDPPTSQFLDPDPAEADELAAEFPAPFAAEERAARLTGE